MLPYITLSAVEIPGWGQISGAMFEDAVTWAEFALTTGTPPMRVLATYGEELRRLLPTWRGQAAMDLLLRVQREMEITPCGTTETCVSGEIHPNEQR